MTLSDRPIQDQPHETPPAPHGVEPLAFEPLAVEPLAYDRSRITCGVLHIGPGAFHRAHQLDFYNLALAVVPHWGVHGVSMHSRDLAAQMAQQDHQYILAILDDQPAYRHIGALTGLSHVADGVWVDVFMSETLHTVTLTITEKGYHLAPSGTLDCDHPAIIADIEWGQAVIKEALIREDATHAQKPQTAPQTAIGLLVYGLFLRKQAGLPAPLIVSCDNLVDNGKKLCDAVVAFAARCDDLLAQWIQQNVRFPSTMVDSITPATDDALRARVKNVTGVEDQCPIQREAFTSWIIEDPWRTDPTAPHPFRDLAQFGVVFTHDLMAHERAKLRILNGSHSTLAYMGLAKNYSYVREAIRDPLLRAIIERQMFDEVIPGLSASAGLDLGAYAQSILKRFENPAIDHRLDQIAWDGSQKIPVRLLGTIAENLASGRTIETLTHGVAAWLRFLHRAARDQAAITDPLADRLLAAAAMWTTSEALLSGIEHLALLPQDIIGNPVFQNQLGDSYLLVAGLE